ncbi:MAG: 2Fe-2S iron-sulfur cluster binding domain-containing protein, partial [Actinomycetota bacterium]|nr:2Fe-2S iron-sulfur cluster binding domain-containing protein [Actinomycetota bacterium]
VMRGPRSNFPLRPSPSYLFLAGGVAPPAQIGSEIECRASGLTLTVLPDQSILDVVHAAGVDALSSCQEGVSATCETAVPEWLPKDRERADNDHMMIASRGAPGPAGR